MHSIVSESTSYTKTSMYRQYRQQRLGTIAPRAQWASSGASWNLAEETCQSRCRQLFYPWLPYTCKLIILANKYAHVFASHMWCAQSDEHPHARANSCVLGNTRIHSHATCLLLVSRYYQEDSILHDKWFMLNFVRFCGAWGAEIVQPMGLKYAITGC